MPVRAISREPCGKVNPAHPSDQTRLTRAHRRAVCAATASLESVTPERLSRMAGLGQTVARDVKWTHHVAEDILARSTYIVFAAEGVMIVKRSMNASICNLRTLATFGLLALGIAAPAYSNVILEIDDATEGTVGISISGCVGLNLTQRPEFASLNCTYIAFFPGTGETVPRLLPGQGTTINFNIFDSIPKSTLSDTLSISFFGISTQPNGANISVDLTFISDTEGVPMVPLPGAISVIETGNLQSLDALIAGTIPASGFSVSFRSDVEDIPEPNTFALLGLSLVGLGLAGSRQQAAQQHTKD